MKEILKKEMGITLTSLVITVIIMLIIASIGVSQMIVSMDNSKDSKDLAELDMIQHAALERYTKYKITKNSSILPGTEININEVQNIATQLGVTLLDTGNYYELNKTRVKRFGSYKYRRYIYN